MEENTSIIKNEEDHILDFLQKTKEGKYAKIEMSSLSFVRIQEKSEPVELLPEDSFYYNIR